MNDSQTKTTQKYLLCTLNHKVQNSSPFALSIISLLEGLGWQSTSKDTKADLIVLLPSDRDRPFTLDDLRVFHRALPGKHKRVMYFHTHARTAFLEGKINNWLFISRCGVPILETLKDWLEPKGIIVPEGSVFNLKKAKKRVKLQKLVDSTMDKYGIPRSGRKILDTKSHAAFYFGLCRINAGYDSLEHSINARTANKDIRDIEKGDLTKIKAFLDSCQDLRSALRASCARPVCKDGEPKPVILLIDDRPEKFVKEIGLIFDLYLPEFEFWIWNPDRTASKINAEDLIYRYDVEHYTSISCDAEKLINAEILVQKWEKKRTNLSSEKYKRKFITFLGRTRCILVDLLFQNAFGQEQTAGYALLRGIKRITHDFKETISSDSGQANWQFPELIAISRANDPSKTLSVFRQGAAGYVPKDRLLSLPGIITANLHCSFGDSNSSHRSFRALDHLPHEIIGLLRSIGVPRIDFHQGGASDEHTDESLTQAIAKLLAALPKADIHVHPGSCMSPEFLVVASLIMLLRHKNGEKLENLKKIIFQLSNIWQGEKPLILAESLAFEEDGIEKRTFILAGETDPKNGSQKGSPSLVENISKWVRDYLIERVEEGEENRRSRIDKRSNEIEGQYTKIRSILHRALNIPDHTDSGDVIQALQKKVQTTSLFLFAMGHSEFLDTPQDKMPQLYQDDILRIFIIWLMSSYKKIDTKLMVKIGKEAKEEIINLNQWFRDCNIDAQQWSNLHSYFYANEPDSSFPYRAETLRNNHWEIVPDTGIDLNLLWKGPTSVDNGNLLVDCPSPQEHPLAWLLASGTRSTNLRDYLEGCEYSGAEHLRHPFLIHLFAQQTIYNFVQHGVLYAELRAAISGYENASIGFSFADACACFCTAFGQAQKVVRDQYHQKRNGANAWLWQKPFSLKELFDPLKSELANYRFPCKVSVALTGKRHKPSRMLIREAGAGAILFSRPLKPAKNAKEFVEYAVSECRIVGFDLAGQEDKHPPHQFRSEYEQISKMHIPITVHAGENAPADFVESAILDLRARRLGHGLALENDKQLMARARDDDICIELCPVSNFQTNAVYPYNSDKTCHYREYPLRKFLEEGLAVTINTDNPIVSYTNMVKECLQASYSYGEPGLSLWELLSILRMGFFQAFLTLPERLALLELADQIVFELFSNSQVARLLEILSLKDDTLSQSN